MEREEGELPMNLTQVIRGRRGQYTIIKQLYDSVWLAINSRKEKVIVKSVNHFRIHNERDVLLRLQSKAPYLRPLLDEIEHPASPPAIVLRYLDDDLLEASNSQRLTRSEVKSVARNVLQALSMLHAEGFVHTDVEPTNVLVNYGNGESRFKKIQLADFGSTVHVDSSYARDGDSIGTAIFRSPEAHLQMSWGTATDVWSFGAMATDKPHLWRQLSYIQAGCSLDHDEYDLKILMKYHFCFGPFPISYNEIADKERIAVLIWVMQNSPVESMRPFSLTTSREICKEDKDFVLRIMKLDPRDRPSAQELLGDCWFDL